MGCVRSAGTKLRIKEFLLNSQNQVVCKVVREVLNLFKMELPVPVEKLPYRKSPEKQAELISNAAYDILELKIENFTDKGGCGHVSYIFFG